MLYASPSLAHTTQVIAYWFILYIYKVFNVLTKMRWQQLSLPEIWYPPTRRRGIVTQMTTTQTSNLLCSQLHHVKCYMLLLFPKQRCDFGTGG